MLDLVEVAVPSPGPGEVVVRIRTALTCGTDLKTYRRGHPRVAFGPFGHEAAGDIAATGEGVEGFLAGQPVAFVHTAGCGRCEQCRRGRENLCATLFEEIALGAYGEFLRLPARIVSRHLFPMPQGLSYLEAAFLEPLACVVHAWERLGLADGASVAVIGLGPIGLLHVHEARRRGHEVIAVGRRSAGLALAERAGAGHALDVPTAEVGQALRARTGGGPDLIIECTGSPDVWNAAPDWAAPGGSVLLFGGLPGGSRVEFDATRLHYGEVDLISAFHYRTADVRKALHLLATGAVRPYDMITGARPLGAIGAVFEDLDRGEGIKYAVLPESGA